MGKGSGPGGVALSPRLSCVTRRTGFLDGRTSLVLRGACPCDLTGSTWRFGITSSAEQPRPVQLVQTFDTFYQGEYRSVVALAAALSGSRWAAEDLAQEAFSAAYREWDRVKGYEFPDLWVRRVVANKSASLIRRSIAEAKARLRGSVAVVHRSMSCRTSPRTCGMRCGGSRSGRPRRSSSSTSTGARWRRRGGDGLLGRNRQDPPQERSGDARPKIGTREEACP